MSMESKRQLYFEDIEVGGKIPTQLRNELTTKTFLEWAAAVRDFYPVHYDKDFALSMNLPGVIAHGPYKLALLGRLVMEWIGEQGVLHKLSCEHRAPSYVGETILCRGKVTNKYLLEGKNYVECEVWVENQDGVVAAPGSATVSLPSRG